MGGARGWGDGGRLFWFEWTGEWGGVGLSLLTFSAFRIGAYSRWALIRGWALIRINMVCIKVQTSYYITVQVPKQKRLTTFGENIHFCEKLNVSN